MAKPNIQNITTTQTFQNWFDKTNEMVDIMREQAVTATITGDLTTGDVNLAGDLQANTLLADTLLQADTITAFTASSPISFNAPVVITGSNDQVVATFAYGAGGGRTRYTDNVISWDIGVDNSTDANFIIDTGTGTPKLQLTPAGTLSVLNFNVEENMTVTGDLNVQDITSIDMTANSVTADDFIGDRFTGNLIGDVYKVNDGVANKVLESGQSGIPAQFTGNVLGTVSDISNHTTNNLTEGSNRLYYTSARVLSELSGGTGVSFNDETGEISIGQIVGTSSAVTFGSVFSTGEVTAFGTVSDRRQKENIKPIDNALDKVSQLGGYTFNYKSKPEEPMTGVMAQELMEVLPEAVYETTDPDTGEAIYAVRHGNVIGLLIEAIKELNEKVGK
jgi:hypothetical protein